MYPDAIDPEMVGDYPAVTGAGGGYVWDAVLEYRVWCHPERGAEDLCEGEGYFYCFVTYSDALEFSQSASGAEAPLALVKQLEFLEELAPGEFQHLKTTRLTEWPVEFLNRPRRNENTIPDFLSPDAPENRLDILRGLVG